MDNFLAKYFSIIIPVKKGWNIFASRKRPRRILLQLATWYQFSCFSSKPLLAINQAGSSPRRAVNFALNFPVSGWVIAIRGAPWGQTLENAADWCSAVPNKWRWRCEPLALASGMRPPPPPQPAFSARPAPKPPTLSPLTLCTKLHAAQCASSEWDIWFQKIISIDWVDNVSSGFYFSFFVSKE